MHAAEVRETFWRKVGRDLQLRRGKRQRLHNEGRATSAGKHLRGVASREELQDPAACWPGGRRGPLGRSLSGRSRLLAKQRPSNKVEGVVRQRGEKLRVRARLSAASVLGQSMNYMGGTGYGCRAESHLSCSHISLDEATARVIFPEGQSGCRSIRHETLCKRVDPDAGLAPEEYVRADGAEGTADIARKPAKLLPHGYLSHARERHRLRSRRQRDRVVVWLGRALARVRPP